MLDSIRPAKDRRWSTGRCIPGSPSSWRATRVDGLLVLFRSDTSLPGAQHVMGDVYYSGEHDVLDQLLKEGKKSSELRLLFGHSGWAPGPLDHELLKRAWEVLPAGD